MAVTQREDLTKWRGEAGRKEREDGLWLHGPWVWISFPLALAGRVQRASLLFHWLLPGTDTWQGEYV